MGPKVSVVIPTYNRDYIVFKAIRSVLEQTYRNLEIIVVDDGSKDKTPYLITKYPVIYVKKPRKGVAHARNRGIFHAKGEYIAFLDSDDIFVKEKIEKQIRFLEKHPELKLVQTEEIWYKGNKRIFPKKIHKKAEGWFFDRAIKLCVVSISTVLIDRSIFKEIGVFDENFWVCEDYEFWLRVGLKYPIGLLKEPLVIKSGGREDQLSATKGLDYYRTLALIKIFTTYQKELTLEQKLMIFAEAKKKFEVFYRGAIKHGNLTQAFYLKNLFDQTFTHSVLHPFRAIL